MKCTDDRVRALALVAIVSTLTLVGLLVVTFAASAEVIYTSQIWDNVGTNTATWVQTNSGNEVQVTIAPNGLQDGTTTIYVCPAKDVATCTSVGTVAAGVSAVNTFTGTSSSFLYVTLTGNTPATGSIDAYVIVKR